MVYMRIVIIAMGLLLEGIRGISQQCISMFVSTRGNTKMFILASLPISYQLWAVLQFPVFSPWVDCLTMAALVDLSHLHGVASLQ